MLRNILISFPWHIRVLIQYLWTTHKQVFSFTNSTENCSYTYPKKLWVHIYGRRYSCDRPGWIYRIYTYVHSIQLLGREHFVPSLTQFEHLSPCFLIHLHTGTVLHNSVPCGISLIISTLSGSKVTTVYTLCFTRTRQIITLSEHTIFNINYFPHDMC